MNDSLIDEKRESDYEAKSSISSLGANKLILCFNNNFLVKDFGFVENELEICQIKEVNVR